MKIEVLCKAYIDTDITPPDYWNSDTVEEYKEDLYAKISNNSMDNIWNNKMKDISEELEIIDVKPYDEGVDEYNNYINEWQEHYNNRKSKEEAK